MSGTSSPTLEELVSAYGVEVKAKLKGPGDPEANIRTPLENLLVAVAKLKGYQATFFDEVSEVDRGVRPDYAFAVNGAITGYVEVKRPGHNLEPDSFRGHDKVQWRRQRDLPNLIYTNGTEFRLYRDGESVGTPVVLTGGSLRSAGKTLAARGEFEALMTNLFAWAPAPIKSVTRLVAAVAPLTRLLRESVLEQLEIESRPGTPKNKRPFTGLADDWRGLLFPEATDQTFADGYAQTVTFALLLARTEGIETGGRSLHEVGNELGASHSLMGRALQLLTDQIAGEFKVTLDLLVRLIGAVDWETIRRGSKDAYLHLYEKFLAVYDPDLRKQSGSYYTPVEVVDEMVRLAEDALKTRLGLEKGFMDEHVLTVDPAMGTGTYLQSIIERSAAAIEPEVGAGTGAELSELAQRLVGFELQTGPFAVAELRIADLLKTYGAEVPDGGIQLFVADTLDDPRAPTETLASSFQAISESRDAAARIKREANVTVVIGNPPYRERAEQLGGWIESGASSRKGNVEPPLADFRAPGNGLLEYVLKNLYVYFWRWATWKAFDSFEADRSGVICFITTSGYLRGPGFKGMREYLRRTASEGWIVDLTPEGHQPPQNTAVFQIKTPVAIGMFVRTRDADKTVPAEVRFQTLEGTRAEKFAALSQLTLDGEGWRPVRTAWQAPFTPAADSDWDQYPALDDLFPWTAPGVKPNRTWVYAPEPSILKERWRVITTEDDPELKAELFNESRDSSLTKTGVQHDGVPFGRDHSPFASEDGSPPDPVPVGYRSLDRQYLIPDARLIDRPRPDLWVARVEGQIFASELHSTPLTQGAAVTFTALIPDMHHYKGSEGGRVLPLLHPDGTANIAPGVLEQLSAAFGLEIGAAVLLTYVAGVASHPSFVETFTDELATPGVRVPITKDPKLFARAVSLGRRVVWLHTYGEAKGLAPTGTKIAFPDGNPRKPTVLKAMTGMPESEGYDPEREVIILGTAEFGPVSPEVAAYEIGGRNVIHSWVGYRKADTAGRRSSPLDDIHVDRWPTEWTREFLDLITVLTRLVDIEPAQAELLEEILAGELFTIDELAGAGVKWPKGRADRQPRFRTDESKLFE